MLAPKSDNRKTTGPIERAARKKSSASGRRLDARPANRPMPSTTARYAKTTAAGIIRRGRAGPRDATASGGGRSAEQRGRSQRVNRVIKEADRKAEHERPGAPPEPEIL